MFTITCELNNTKMFAALLSIVVFEYCVCAESLQLCPILCDLMLLCPWDSSGKSTREGCHLLLQGVFLTQVLNLHLFTSTLHLQCISLHWQAGSLLLAPPGKPKGLVLFIIFLLYNIPYCLNCLQGEKMQYNSF